MSFPHQNIFYLSLCGLSRDQKNMFSDLLWKFSSRIPVWIFFLDKCLSPVVKDQTVYIFRLCCVWNWEPVFLLVIWWSLFAQIEFLSVWFKVMLVHPERTLSGWWDVKIPKRTNQPFACFHLFFQTAGNRLSVFLIKEQRLHHAPNRS